MFSNHRTVLRNSRLLSFGVLLLLLSSFVQGYAQRPKKGTFAENRSQRAPQVRFQTGDRALGIPFVTSSNLILLQARVNDSSPLWFILDTGADSTVIDVQLAKLLRLKSYRKMIGTGAAGTAEGVIYKSVNLRFSNVEALNRTVVALPLDSLSPHLGVKISGVIGNDIIKETVVEVDYASQIINLYDPKAYRYSGTGTVIPITIDENLPFVRTRAAFEGQTIEGKFELDSGSTGAVLFNTPFVQKHKLLTAVPETNQTRMGGVGGTELAYVGRIKRILLGSITIENPVARFSQGERGDNASDRYDGRIGGEIFRRFKSIFDYFRKRIILENNAPVTESYEVDMSGLELVGDGDDYSIVLVDDVEAGSVAAKAGIQGGDIITAIGDRPASAFTLDQVRQMFMKDGREYLLTLRRGQNIVQAKLKLKRLI
ncbi:MAG: hypothetical protein C5B55_05150 [Blastocatellia bacterium]|nr:MAG: hypothetical protein C5B55_05150 [Blastocatellia bacterium]